MRRYLRPSEMIELVETLILSHPIEWEETIVSFCNERDIHLFRDEINVILYQFEKNPEAMVEKLEHMSDSRRALPD